MLGIGSINIHHTRVLKFVDKEHDSTKWLDIRIQCDYVGSDCDSVSLIYDSAFSHLEVEKAMIKYLEAKGYSITQPNESWGFTNDVAKAAIP